MKRIIINYDDKMKEIDVVNFVKEVISSGRISGSKEKKQFCYATVFNKKIGVYAKINKNLTDTFLVTKK